MAKEEKLNNKLLKSERMFSNKFLLKLLMPLFVEQIFMFAIGVADSIMVSVAGESAVSAVSLVDQIMMLIIATMAALSTGGAVVIGQYLGQKKKKMTVRAADQLMLAALLLALAITALLYILKDILLPLIFGNIEKEVMDYCNTYYMITVASVPFIAVYNAGSAMFRSVGNSKISMIICGGMNLINIPGNYILLHIVHMQVAGVAIPTLIARVAAAIAVYVCLRNQALEVHLSKKFVYIPNIRLIKQILRIGIPNGVENGMFQLGKLMLLSFISSMGTASITANAVSNTIASIAIIPGMTIGLGVVAVISRCVGAGDYRQVTYYIKKLILWAYIVMGVTNGIGILIIPFMMNVYGLSPETAHLATVVLLINFISSIAIWPISFTFPNALRASGDVMYTMIVGVGSMWLFRIIGSILLAKFMGLGLVGIWIGMVIDWIVRSICFIIRYCSGKWKHGAIK
ncbi:MAG: MATE family efflux transporter [Firmicutes bacterium]|nr:MATE family efflux transporter [Bacillota bacterium]